METQQIDFLHLRHFLSIFISPAFSVSSSFILSLAFMLPSLKFKLGDPANTALSFYHRLRNKLKIYLLESMLLHRC